MPSSPNGINDFTNAFTKAIEDINALISSYVSAATKSNAALWQGIEDITRSVGGLTQESFARTVSAYTTLSSAKTPQEAADMHAGFMKDSFDSAVANSGKVSEISVRIAQEAMNPLTQHANETISTMVKKTK
jgi:phasin family protein